MINHRDNEHDNTMIMQKCGVSDPVPVGYTIYGYAIVHKKTLHYPRKPSCALCESHSRVDIH